MWGQSLLQNVPTGSGHATGVNKCSFPFNGLSNQLKLYMIGSEGSIYFDLDKLIGYRNYIYKIPLTKTTDKVVLQDF